MSDIENFGRRNHQILGELVSLTTSYHHVLVIALAVSLDIDLLESQIVFAPRATGDISATLKTLLKHRGKTDKKIPIDKILSLMGKINKLMSRTNHVHGHVAMYPSTETGLPDEKTGVIFTRYDISGASFKVVQKSYETSDEFSKAVNEARTSIDELQKLLGVTYEIMNEYVNLKHRK